MKTSDNLALTGYFISHNDKVGEFFLDDCEKFNIRLKKYEVPRPYNDLFTAGIKAGYFKVTRGDLFDVYKNFAVNFLHHGLEYNTIIYEAIQFFYTFNLKTKSIEYVNLEKFFNSSK